MLRSSNAVDGVQYRTRLLVVRCRGHLFDELRSVGVKLIETPLALQRPVNLPFLLLWLAAPGEDAPHLTTGGILNKNKKMNDVTIQQKKKKRKKNSN